MDHLALKNLVKNFVKNFSLLFSESSLYPPQHPNVIAQTKQTFSSLQTILEQAEELFIDIREGQFVFSGIPLYELRHTVEKTVQMLEMKDIKTFCFKKSITPQQLARMIGLILDKSRALNAEGLQKALAKEGITSIVIEREKSASKDAESEHLAPATVYGSSVEANKLLYNSLQTSNILPMDIVDKVAQDITEMIATDSTSSLVLTSLRNYDEYTFTHSANVAILSVAVGTTFINSPALLQRLARAALLHDIGKTKIPLRILNKSEKLTDDEWQIMKNHAIWGAQILEQQSSCDALAILIAAQHHMKYDLSGYPVMSGVAQLHPLSLVVNICDVYDAITSKRPYKNPLPPDKALAIMLRLLGCDFDPHFFKIFIQMMGIYPPGSLVRLNTMEIAITRRVHPNALLLPEIKIIMDASGAILNPPLFI
ncbi:MAG: HD-GYP domain-containing protein, partial [Candidatus Omnitrophica bacterium]|nr:HD-GYP domain-containing protein [Candidatus Omnitrophota bacterium]